MTSFTTSSLCSVCKKPLGEAVATCLCLPSHGSFHPGCEDRIHHLNPYHHPQEPEGEDSIDSIIRDFTQAAPRTKSEVRRRLETALSLAESKGVEKERKRAIRWLAEHFDSKKEVKSSFDIGYSQGIASVLEHYLPPTS